MSTVEQIALGAVQWRLANRQRAQLYGWFATLYAAEVSEVALEGYLGDGYQPLYTGLADLGLGAEVAASWSSSAIRGWSRWPMPVARSAAPTASTGRPGR